jgi:DNA polymerase-1
MGAKTGRWSSTPNVQNVSKDDPGFGLTSVRSFIAAPRGFRIVCGDIRQQEPSLCAHFAGGAIAESYRQNPEIDRHLLTANDMTKYADHQIPRSQGKTLNLAVTYALGELELADRLGTDRGGARKAKNIWKKANPDIVRLDAEVRKHWALGGALETWGGAQVYCEEPTPIYDGDGNHIDDRTWEYRGLNRIIQQSASEQLEECMIAADAAGLLLILSVHDELATESHARKAKHDLRLLQEILETTGDFDVPMLADVGLGQNWWEAKP